MSIYKFLIKEYTLEIYLMFLFVNVVFLFEWVYAIKVNKNLTHKNNPYVDSNTCVHNN
jgi:hypothetical protein